MTYDQEAKADAGKLRPTLVEPDFVRSAAKLVEYDMKAKERLVPKLLRPSETKKYYGVFECPYCGKEFEACIHNITSGRQHSCGCAKGRFAVETRGTHGESKTRLYRMYHHILERCNNPSCKEYKWYGARGIKCEFANYEEFRDFANANGYNDKLTVERINVDGNYSCDNITFIPQRFQMQNTTKSIKITYQGVTLCASEWGRILGIHADTITRRKRSGWSDQKTIETPVKNSIDAKLVPMQIVEDIREVRLFGLKKYSDPDNWRKVSIDRYKDAFYRHFLAYIDDPKSVDEESGLPHLWHCACNLAFICELEKHADERT